MTTDRASKIRILLIDDHALFRDSLARLLADEPDFEIAGACSSAADGLQILASAPVDIVLLDWDLQTERGSAFLDRAAGSGFRGRVLVVAAAVTEREALELVRKGAAGILLKFNTPALLAKAIRKVMGGELWLDQNYLRVMLGYIRAQEEPAQRDFTQRQRELLRCVVEGLANKEIARSLQISESSVKSALQQLFRRAGVHTRSQLVRFALEQARESERAGPRATRQAEHPV